MRKILALLLSLVLANPVGAQTIAQPPGTGGGGGGGTPGGASGSVQYNNAGAFGGFTVGGDGTLNTSTGALSVTKTGGVSFGALATLVPGTGVATALGVNVGSAGAVVVNGGALGTPSSGTLTNATGLPLASGISGFGTGIASALAINTGSAGAPVLLNGALGTPSSGTLTNATGLPVSTGISGLGTGVATALGNTAGAAGGFATFNQLGGLATITPGTGVATAAQVNIGSAGSFLVNGGALGTPSSGTLTNATGLPISTGVSGLGLNVATALSNTAGAAGGFATFSQLGGLALITPGTGVATALGVNVGTAGSIVVNGGALGTPSSGTLTNATGLPVSTGISGLGTGVATALANTAGATNGFATFNQLGALATITPGTGVATALGVNVGTAGSFVVNGGALGTPSSGTLTNATGLPISTGVSGLGTGVATALAVNTGSAGAFARNNAAETISGAYTFTSAAPQLTLGTNATTLGSIKLFGNTSGDLTISPAAAAGTASAVTFPGRSGTVAYTSGTLTDGNCAKFDASGNIVDFGSTCGGGGGGTPGGSSGQVQYNNAGAFGGFTVGGDGTLDTSTGALSVTKTGGVSFSSLATLTPAAGIATWLGTPSSANLASAVTDETGSGSLVFATSPSLTTPSIGAASGTSVTLTGVAPQVTLGLSASVLGSIKLFGNTSGDLTISPAAAAGTASVVTFPGRSGTVGYTSGTLTNNNCVKFDASGNLVDAGVTCTHTTPGGTSGQVQYNNGGAFGGFTVGGDGTLNTGTGALTVTKTNGTNFSSLATTASAAGIVTWLGTPSSANLASAITDETGSGSLVFATSPTLTTPNIGTASGNSVTLTAAAPQVTLGVNATTLGSIKLFGNTSGDLTISPAAVAGTASAVTFPGRSGTVAYTSGTLTNGNCVKFDASGNLVDNGSTCATAAGGTSGQVQYNNGGAFGGFTVGGDGTLNTGTGALTVTKTNGTAFSSLATLTPGTNVTGWLTTPSSANLASALTDETGSGSVVFSTSPILTTPNIGAATGSTLTLNGTQPQLTLGANATTLGGVKLFGSTSGDVTVKAAAVAGTSTVFQLPSSNGTSGYSLRTDGTGVTSWGADREVLSANRTYYVRATIGAPTFTASSANITLTSHGLSVNDPVVLSILPKEKQFTITNANPGVVTTASAHGFAAGQPVKFASTGYLPPGITAGTTYYVISTGLTSTAFQFSATVGGAAVNTSKLTFTAASGTGGAIQITSSANHGLIAGQKVAFSSSGTLPTNLSASTTYYVASSPAPTATVFYVATTNGGTNVAYSSAGTGTHSLEQVGVDSAGTATAYGSNTAYHRVEATGAMPTFSTAGLLVAGTVYYVGTVVDANTITLSTTLSNANPLGTATLATGTPIYSLATGSDSNTGTAATRAAAFLTIQKAIDTAFTLDWNNKSVTIQVADSVYTVSAPITMYGSPLGFSSGYLTVQGNTTAPGNAFVQMTSGTGSTFTVGGAHLALTGLKIANSSGSGEYLVTESDGATVSVDKVELGACPLYALVAVSSILNVGDVIISAAPYSFISVESAGLASVPSGKLITVLGTPAWSLAFVVAQYNGISKFQATITGSASGGFHYYAVGNGVIYVGGAGENYFPGPSTGIAGNGGQYF